MHANPPKLVGQVLDTPKKSIRIQKKRKQPHTRIGAPFRFLLATFQINTGVPPAEKGGFDISPVTRNDGFRSMVKNILATRQMTDKH